MFIWIMIVIFVGLGIGLVCVGVKLMRMGDALGGYVGIIAGIGFVIYALYPLYGNLILCEYVPTGADTYTQERSTWEGK